MQAQRHRQLAGLSGPEPASESVTSDNLWMTTSKVIQKDGNRSSRGMHCNSQIFPLYSLVHSTNTFDHKLTMYIQHPLDAKKHNVDVDLDNGEVPN